MTSSPAMRAAVVGHVEWIEFAAGAARAGAGRDRPRHASVRGAGRRRRGGGGPAREARRRAPPSSPPSATTSSATAPSASSRSSGCASRAASGPSRSGAPSSTSTTAASARSPCSAPRLGPRGDDPLAWERARRHRRRVPHRRRRGGGAPRAPRRACWWPRRAGSRRCRRRAWSSTRSCRAAATPASATSTGDLDPAPRVVVRTRGRRGRRVGDRRRASAASWEAAPLPGPVRDAYGCGDSFAAGLTYGLGAGWAIDRGGRAGAPAAAPPA